jgi:CpcD/allophycocyanin linker domain
MMNTTINLSGNTERIFAIDIAGSPHQAMLRSSAYTVKVAYSSLSKTLQSIGKRGGKVVNVRMLSTPMPSIENIPVAVAETSVEAPSAAKISTPKVASRRSSSKSKKR